LSRKRKQRVVSGADIDAGPELSLSSEQSVHQPAVARNSSALICNTSCSFKFLDYIYRPPNNEGFKVEALRG
jgi:hypothetical protein